MEHDYFRYSPLPQRAPIAWPAGARLAAFVILYVEHWELTPPDEAHRDPRFIGEYGSFYPDYRTWTQREYGNRVGIFRVLDVLDTLGIVPAIAANAAVVQHAPGLVERLAARGCEIIAHGIAASQMLSSRMDETAERTYIATTLDILERATGQRPRGWIGQDFGESARTPRALAQAGLKYVLDWPNDDEPYWLATAPPLLSIPNQADWDDVQMQWLRRVPPADYARHVVSALTTLHAESAASGRVFGLGIHPWLAGMPNRIRYLRELLTTLRAFEQVWWTRPGEVAGAFADQSPPV